MYKTTNFGDNWIQQSNPAAEFLNSINFPNVITGFACGENSKFIKTINGGNNWFIINPIYPSIASWYRYTNVLFVDSLNGYTTAYSYGGDTSLFIKTTNGGVNWSIQMYPVYVWGRFTAMFFLNINTGFVGSTTYIHKTTDAGVSWNKVLIPTSNLINSLYFPNASTGYGACYGGQILKTTNGGNNWFLQTTGTGSNLISIFFINNFTGCVSGENNTVLKTTDGGGPPIGIEPISNEVPKDFVLYQNYPNPFNPSTKIRFSVPSRKFDIPANQQRTNNNVQLIVFDILGREVATLINEQLKPGTYEVEFNGDNYASGVYYYTLQTESFNQTKRMVLIK